MRRHQNLKHISHFKKKNISSFINKVVFFLNFCGLLRISECDFKVHFVPLQSTLKQIVKTMYGTKMLHYCNIDEFIRWFHHSRILNLRFFIMNVFYELFVFKWREKKLFWTNKKFEFFELLKLRKIRKTSDELVIFLRGSTANLSQTRPIVHSAFACIYSKFFKFNSHVFF